MPKVERDESLISRLNVVVEQCGSVGAAATALGVSRTLLWRFQQSGRGIGRTRARLMLALKQHENETEVTKNVTSSVAVPNDLAVPEAEIFAMRAFFQNMLNVIDAYIANPLGNASFAEFAKTVSKSQFSHADVTTTGEKNGRSQ